MRTKTLLLTAALSAAGVAASMAQVYSVNVVGYVNATVPASGWAILNNPLKNGDNNIGTVMQLPTGSSGATVYTWNKDTQAFVGPFTYLEGAGWLSSDPAVALPTVAPGDGFFILNITASPLVVTFVGEVLQGPLSTAIKSGAWNLVGSKVPMAANLGNPSDAASLQFPSTTGDTVYQFDTATQKYTEAATYLDGAGWVIRADIGTGPVVPVGNGFWVLRVATSGPDWNRTFNVQ